MKKILMLAVIMFSSISMFGIGHRNYFNRIKDNTDYELLDSLGNAGYGMLPEVIIYGNRIQDTIKCKKDCKMKNICNGDTLNCKMKDSLKTNDVIVNNYFNDYFNDDFYYSNRLRYFEFNDYFHNYWYYDPFQYNNWYNNPFYYNDWYKPYYGSFGLFYPKYDHRKFYNFLWVKASFFSGKIRGCLKRIVITS